MLANAGFDLIIPLPDFISQIAGRFLFLHGKLGIAMHMLEPLFHFLLIRFHFFDDIFHNSSQLLMLIFLIPVCIRIIYSDGSPPLVDPRSDFGIVTMIETMAATTISKLTLSAKNAAWRTATLSCRPR